MAWTFVGVSNVVEVTATAHALVTTGITGLAAGDLMIACISSRIASSTSVTLPAGWTLIGEQKNNNILATSSAYPSGMMAYCIRGATNPALTFTHPVAPAPALGRIVAYREAAVSRDIQTGFATATAITAVSGVGLTTTSTDELIVAMAAGGQAAAWSAFNATSPAGASGTTSTAAPTTTWRERADSSTTTGNDTSLAIFDAIKTTAGATGNLTATASVPAGQVVIACAFKPVGAVADAWNANDRSGSVALSNSDKTAALSLGTASGVRSTTGRTGGAAGKYYAEFVSSNLAGGNIRVGLKTKASAVAGASAEIIYIQSGNGGIILDVTTIGSIGSAWVAGDVICIAWDSGAERFWARKNNGLWNNDASANPATGTNGLDVSTALNTEHCLWFYATPQNANCTVRTELAEFTQSPLPSGFTAWMGEALPTSITGTLSVTEGADTISAAGTVEAGEAATGTLDVTEANDTLAAAATVTVRGTLSVTEANDTISAAATVVYPVITGTLSVTEASDTLSATATIGYPVVTGTLNVTEANDTVSAAGGPVVNGTLSATEANDTISAAATAGVGGALSVTEANDTISATGGAVIGGALVVTEANDTISATASVSLVGALSLTEANDTLAATGTVEAVAAVTGTLDITEANDTISAAATATVSGALNVTEANDTLAALATITIGGALNVAEANDTLSSAGTVSDYPVVTGTLNVTEADDTISALATVTGEAVVPPVVGGGYYTPPRPYLVTGVGYGIMPPIEGAAFGVVRAGAGVGQGQLPGLAGRAVGSIGAAGILRVRLEIKAEAHGQRGQTGAAIARLGGISATSTGRAAVSGKGVGMIMKFEGAAIGQHTDDEAEVVTFLLAA